MSERYRVEPTGKGFWPYCVRAGNGTRDLYVGHKKTCDRVAAELTTAFRDGEFVGKGTLRRPSRRDPGSEGTSQGPTVSANSWQSGYDEGRRMGTKHRQSEVEQLSQEVSALRTKLAMAEDAAAKGDAARHQCGGMEMEIEELRAELATLRARVVVVPERKLLNAGVPGLNRNSGWNDCLDELARLNGKTVSEGLLRKWLELMEHGDYREGHCMCGSPVDSHGIGDGHAPIDAGEYYAGQVMEELRALLNQDKENGNG